jgi:hypothetical protein
LSTAIREDGKMGVRSALVRAGLVRPPFEPHEFERDMHMLYAPAPGPSVASVPNPITPRSSAERCARDGCGRPVNDPIHRVGED